MSAACLPFILCEWSARVCFLARDKLVSVIADHVSTNCCCTYRNTGSHRCGESCDHDSPNHNSNSDSNQSISDPIPPSETERINEHDRVVSNVAVEVDSTEFPNRVSV